MAVGDRKDPFLGFRFRVEIEGLVAGGFSDVSGLQAEIETEEYREGGANRFVHKLTKPMKHPNLTLKRGLADSDALWKWLHSVGKKGSKIDRKRVRIILLDSEGKEKVSWRCLQAYPIKWAASDLKADASNVVIESLELVHCGIELA
jgi:phage tail-like protein